VKAKSASALCNRFRKDRIILKQYMEHTVGKPVVKLRIVGQPAKWCGVTAPVEGGVDITFETEDGQSTMLYLKCENARRFCNALNDSLLYFEELGDQPGYKFVDRSKTSGDG